MDFVASYRNRAGMAVLALALSAGTLVIGAPAHASVPWICGNGQVCGYDPSGKVMFVVTAPPPGQCTTTPTSSFGPVTTVVNASDTLVKLSAAGCAQAAADPQITAPPRQTVTTSYWLRIGTRISAAA
ncbi:hypothetical protein SMC26_16455 [Actinomadura fulvescens]|uniref:Secreted protein n=1 Tax=Actinomadura fulvescens TaxID=46160 RepID=A0ABP6BUU3_9ACTN